MFSFLPKVPRFTQVRFLLKQEYVSSFLPSSMCTFQLVPLGKAGTATIQPPSPLEPPRTATACPSRLAGYPSPSEGHQARVELQGETRSHSSTPSTYREPGLVMWEGGSLGPASPYHCFVGSGPTKSSRSRVGSLLWCQQGSREQRFNPRS